MFTSAYDGKQYKDEIAAKQAEYAVETGEKISRKVAEIILDREADAKNSAFSGDRSWKSQS